MSLWTIGVGFRMGVGKIWQGTMGMDDWQVELKALLAAQF